MMLRSNLRTPREPTQLNGNTRFRIANPTLPIDNRITNSGRVQEILIESSWDVPFRTPLKDIGHAIITTAWPSPGAGVEGPADG